MITKFEQVFYVLYRPPDSSFNTFGLFRNNFSEFVSQNDYCLILGGDLDVNILGNSTVSSQLNNINISAGFMSTTTSPTRVTLSTSSAIYLFVPNVSAHVKVTGTIVTDISDHNAILNLFSTVTLKELHLEFLPLSRTFPIGTYTLLVMQSRIQTGHRHFPNLVPMTRIMYL